MCMINDEIFTLMVNTLQTRWMFIILFVPLLRLLILQSHYNPKNPHPVSHYLKPIYLHPADIDGLRKEPRKS
jgi:hypothetical protein